jgi:hypothetical protein
VSPAAVHGVGLGLLEALRCKVYKVYDISVLCGSNEAQLQSTEDIGQSIEYRVHRKAQGVRCAMCHVRCIVPSLSLVSKIVIWGSLTCWGSLTLSDAKICPSSK